MQQNQSADDTWKNVAPILDEGLGRLRETDRDAIILRFFQNEPLGKVGEKLGVSEEAAGKRIARALETLRGFFGRRGFSITSGILAASLTKHSAQAAPVHLGSSVITSVFMHAPVTTAAHYALVQETLKAWQWTKAKWLMGLGSAAAVAVLLIAPSLPARYDSGRSQTLPAKVQLAAATSAKNDIAGSDPAAVSPMSTTAAAPAGPVFKFQAIDGVTGRGLAGARVLAVVAQDPQHIDTKTNLVTDAQGRCEIPMVFSNCQMVGAGVIADGYEERSVFAGGNEPVPAGWVLKMYRGGTIGGVVQDESGRPVANANILVQFFGTGDSSAREFQRERPGFPDDNIVVATTDAFGHWQFRSAPETNGDFFVAVRHSQFPNANFQTDADSRNYVQPNRVALELLHAGRAVLVLKSGSAFGGFVTDEQQNPIANAKVQFGENFDGKGPTATTDAKGAFTLNNLKVGSGHITVTAPGFAPERLPVDVASDSKPLTVQLKPGALLRVRVVDENGKGMPDVDVRLQGWRGNNTLEWLGATDNDGCVSWDSAPVDQLDIFAGKKGYFYSRQNFMTADGEEHVIKMRRELTVSGWALDAATGQAITDFKAVPGADRLELAHGTNGQYCVTFHEFNPPLQVTIEADGYEPLVSEAISSDTNQVVWNAQLKKLDPNQAIAGTIVFPDGTPAVGAQVALCTQQGGVMVGRGKFLDYGDSPVKNTDDKGQFLFAPDNTASVVVAIHPRGYASIDLHHAARPLVIQLQPWGRIEGSLKLRTESNAGRDIILGKVNYTPQAGPGVNFDLRSFTVTTDDNGNFVFDQAPPGSANLYMSAGLGIPFSHQTPVLVPASGTVQVQIGGTGVIIKGRFVLSDPARTIHWPKQVWVASIGTKLAPLAVPTDLPPQKRRAWVQAFDASDAGIARARASRSFPLNVSDDGSFSVEGVPPGDYALNASFAKETVDRSNFTGGRVPLIGSAHQDVTISDQPTDAKEVDLGTVMVQVR
jgi:hypothetical protein